MIISENDIAVFREKQSGETKIVMVSTMSDDSWMSERYRTVEKRYAVVDANGNKHKLSSKNWEILRILIPGDLIKGTKNPDPNALLDSFLWDVPAFDVSRKLPWTPSSTGVFMGRFSESEIPQRYSRVTFYKVFTMGAMFALPSFLGFLLIHPVE